MASPHQATLEAFGRFRTSWPRRGWSYDSRVQCVASTFDSEFAPQARLLIAPILPHAWTERTLASASPLIARVATRTGGVRASQMIFGADAAGYVTAYGLWWPWEEGRTISLRIGLEGGSAADINDLCTVFGAEQLRAGPRSPAHARRRRGQREHARLRGAGAIAQIAKTRTCRKGLASR